MTQAFWKIVSSPQSVEQRNSPLLGKLELSENTLLNSYQDNSAQVSCGVMTSKITHNVFYDYLKFSVTKTSRVCVTWLMKNQETDAGFQPKRQKFKAVSHWFLLLPQSEMTILPPGISEWECSWEPSPHILYSCLGLELKACTIAQILWQSSVDYWD